MGFEQRRRVFNTTEENTNKAIDDARKELSNEQEKNISVQAKKDYAAYLDNKNNPLWQMRSGNIIAQIKEAEELLKTRNSYGVETGFEKREIETDHDEARMVALCRAIEDNKH